MKPSPVRIIWNDWPCLAMAIAIPMFSGLFGYMAHKEKDKSWIIVLIVLLTIFTFVLLWRFIRVYSLFLSGRPIGGFVTALSIEKDRGRLEYEYLVEGELMKSWIPIHKTKRVFECARKTEVTVLFDPENPRDSTVRELFQRDPVFDRVDGGSGMVEAEANSMERNV